MFRTLLAIAGALLMTSTADARPLTYGFEIVGTNYADNNGDVIPGLTLTITGQFTLDPQALGLQQRRLDRFAVAGLPDVFEPPFFRYEQVNGPTNRAGMNINSNFDKSFDGLPNPAVAIAISGLFSNRGDLLDPFLVRPTIKTDAYPFGIYSADNEASRTTWRFFIVPQLPVPEAPSAALLAAGTGAVAAGRRRRKTA